MIEIEAVQPNAREFRAIQKGWGAIHWVCMLPTHAYLLGFVCFGVIATALAGDVLPSGLFSICLVASFVLWLAGRQWLTLTVLKEQSRSPGGGLPWRWTIDVDALMFDTGLQSNRVDWRAVKSAREETDRFLFLVTPGYNPVLPKRQMTEQQIDSLRSLIAEVTASGQLGSGVKAEPQTRPL